MCFALDPHTGLKSTSSDLRFWCQQPDLTARGDTSPPRPPSRGLRNHKRCVLSSPCSKGQKGPKRAKKGLEGPRSAKKCQEVPRSAKKCQEVPRSAKKCQEVPRSAKKCQDGPRRTKMGQEVPLKGQEGPRKTKMGSKGKEWQRRAKGKKWWKGKEEKEKQKVRDIRKWKGEWSCNDMEEKWRNKRLASLRHFWGPVHMMVWKWKPLFG